MKSSKIVGYFVLVVCLLVLLAGIVLVALQWAQRTGVNLYGYPCSTYTQNNKTAGGVNTALLMLLSAGGGIIAVFLVKLICWAVGSIRRAGRARAGMPRAAPPPPAAPQRPAQ